MHRKGMYYPDIAKELGVKSPTTISNWVNELLEERAVEGVNQYRATVEDRLDHLVSLLHAELQESDITVSQKLKIYQQLASIEMKRVSLLGLAVPVKTVVELQSTDVWEDD